MGKYYDRRMDEEAPKSSVLVVRPWFQVLHSIVECHASSLGSFGCMVILWDAGRYLNWIICGTVGALLTEFFGV